MKDRTPWILLLLGLLAAAFLVLNGPWRNVAPDPGAGRRPSLQDDAPPLFTAVPPPSLRPPTAAPETRRLLPPPPAFVPPDLTVPIQDGATIDFSIGAPVVRSGGSDTEALERSLREMAEAVKNITIGPSSAADGPAAPPPREP